MGSFKITSLERKLIQLNDFLRKEVERAFSEGFREGSYGGCDENEAFSDFMVDFKNRIAKKEKQMIEQSRCLTNVDGDNGNAVAP